MYIPSISTPLLLSSPNTLPALLQNISARIFPELQEIAVDVYNNPENSGSEFFAHDRVVDYFMNEMPGLWEVTPHAYGEETAWTLNYVYNPNNADDIPVFGFLSEYDALPAIGHACGHNLILLNGLASASMMREAVIELDIPVNITIFGTPDEEVSAGKQRLYKKGAFEGLDAVVMAHPTSTSAIQPMSARRDMFVSIVADTNEAMMKAAYDELILIQDLAGTLPGTNTTAVPILNLGDYSINVVATETYIGITGLDETDIASTIDTIKAGDAAYAEINYTLTEVDEGISIYFSGAGGHAALGTASPLTLSIEVYRTISTGDTSGTLSYFLPYNTTATEIDITVSVRSRYTLDMQEVEDVVSSHTSNIPAQVTWDGAYPALEVTPVLPDLLIALMESGEFEDEEGVWAVSPLAPAATDASFVQQPSVDSATYSLTATEQVVFHPNFGICPPGTAVCPFNHMAEFQPMAGTDYAYGETEKIARALAHLMIELASNSTLLASVREITK